jgi:hypothetical protein
MELPIEFQNKANKIEERLANTEHKIRGVDKADGYTQGALDTLKAVEADYNNDIQTLMRNMQEAAADGNAAALSRYKYQLEYVEIKAKQLKYIKPL